jgi:hypothetical protein
MSGPAVLTFEEATPAARGVTASLGRVLLLAAIPLSLVWIPVGRLPGMGNVAASDVALLGLWALVAVALLVRGGADVDPAAALMPVLALLVAALAGLGSEISLPQGKGLFEALSFMKRFGLAAIMPLAAILFRSPGMERWTRWVCVLTLAILAAFTLDPSLQARLPRPEDWNAEAMADRATGSVTNPNDLAYASVSLFVLYGALWPRRARAGSWVLLAFALAAAGVCLVSSGSRSGVIGAGAALGYVLLSARIGLRTKAALIAAAVTVVAAGWSRSTVFEERLGRAYREGLGEINVYSRLDAQWLAVRAAVAHPVGVGFTSFGEVTAAERTYFVLGTADSVYVDTLLGAGFAGLLLLLGLFWLAWRQTARGAADARRASVLRAGLVAFFVFGLATVVPVSVFLAPLFFTLAAASAYPEAEA